MLLRNPETGFERSTETNDRGIYVFLNVLPGRYKLQVAKEGFSSSANKTGILVVVGEATTHDFTMSVGEARQSITVDATPATATAGLGTAVMERQAEKPSS